MRASDVDAALYYLARMVEGGEDPKFIARRMVIFASEDIGMAQPNKYFTKYFLKEPLAIMVYKIEDKL
jgi:replication-associated recombination protein RarA